MSEQMSDGEFLDQMGTDAEKWAQGWQERTNWFVPERVLIPWFANAIEAGRAAGVVQGQRDEQERHHTNRCCAACDWHTMPHRGCILR